MFRLLVGKRAALDYFEFVLSLQPDGTVLANDVDNFRSGEKLSQTVRREYLSRAVFFSKVRNLAALTQQEREFIENKNKISEMESYAHAGDGRQALAIYSRLPASMQSEKFVLLSRLGAANLLGGEVYEQAVKAIQLALPGDPCLDIALRDYYLMHRQYDKYRQTIDQLDRRTGGDPYLDFLRAISYLMEKKDNLARDWARKAIKTENTLLPAYHLLLQIALQERDFDEVTRLLTVAQDNCRTAFSDPTTLPAYAEFVKSPQYQAWLKNSKTK